MIDVELMDVCETDLKSKFKPNDVVWVSVPGVMKPAIVERILGVLGRTVMYEVEYCNGDEWFIEEFAESQLKTYTPRQELVSMAYGSEQYAKIVPEVYFKKTA